MSFPKVCGILVEPRKMDNIIILIDNFFQVLPGRHLFFFCGHSHFNYYKQLLSIYSNQITLIDLKVDNLTPYTHNDLWKSFDFWNHFNDYTHVLTIQTDGCLCPDSPYKIEDFFSYDYIGGYSPYKWWWKETQGLHKFSDYQCFNG